MRTDPTTSVSELADRRGYVGPGLRLPEFYTEGVQLRDPTCLHISFLGTALCPNGESSCFNAVIGCR